jgi:endonuclease/exonuclease/phosphatase family metal-dependent hydrolase
MKLNATILLQHVSRSLPSGVVWLAMTLPATADEANELAVMSFNTWHQWGQVRDGFAKAKAAIVESGAAVVGLQESSPQVAEKMAAELGWHHAKGGTGSVQILSRHPIVQSILGAGIGSDRMLGARLRIGGSPEREVLLFNLHLDYRFYGPYAARTDDATEATVLEENGRSERLRQVEAILNSIRTDLARADQTPVIVTGDFNVPSHLDWTETVRDQHAGLTVIWPETKRFEDAGLRDTFRIVHPDPREHPGTTWSPIHQEGEPQDRIDFILCKGSSLRVLSSRTFTTQVETTTGPWGSDLKGVPDNSWPSDHAAVITVFDHGGP